MFRTLINRLLRKSENATVVAQHLAKEGDVEESEILVQLIATYRKQGQLISMLLEHDQAENKDHRYNLTAWQSNSGGLEELHSSLSGQATAA